MCACVCLTESVCIPVYPCLGLDVDLGPVFIEVIDRRDGDLLRSLKTHWLDIWTYPMPAWGKGVSDMELTQTRLSLRTGLGCLEGSGSHLRDRPLELLGFMISHLPPY